MTWQDRVGDLILETSQGDVFNCEYTDISSRRTDRTDVTEFSNNIDYVQKLYFGSRVFNLMVKFSGGDCDITAKKFEEATKDTKPIKMTHPLETKIIKGVITSVEKIDAIATSANEVTFNIVFHESSEPSILVKAEDLGRYIDVYSYSLNLIDASAFAENINKIEDTSVLDQMKNYLSDATKILASTAKAYNYATDKLVELESLIIQTNNLLDTIETNAESYASLYQALTQFPAKALDMVDKLDFYESLYDSIFALLSSTPTESTAAAFTLQGSCFISGYCLAASDVDETVFVNKTACFDLIEYILALKDKFTSFLEESENLGYIDVSQDALNTLSNITANTSGSLTQTAFYAKQTHIVTLEQDTDVYTLVYKKTAVDTPEELEEEVEYFTDINKLGGSELFRLKKGKKVRFYI